MVRGVYIARTSNLSEKGKNEKEGREKKEETKKQPMV
jgi:hypothetical protein